MVLVWSRLLVKKNHPRSISVPWHFSMALLEPRKNYLIMPSKKGKKREKNLQKNEMPEVLCNLTMFFLLLMFSMILISSRRDSFTVTPLFYKVPKVIKVPPTHRFLAERGNWVKKSKVTSAKKFCLSSWLLKRFLEEFGTRQKATPHFMSSISRDSFNVTLLKRTLDGFRH